MSKLMAGRDALNENIGLITGRLGRPVQLYASNTPEPKIKPHTPRTMIQNLEGIELSPSYGNVIRTIAPLGYPLVDKAIFCALRYGMPKKFRGGVHTRPIMSASGVIEGYDVSLMAPQPGEFNTVKGYVHIVDSADFAVDTKIHPEEANAESFLPYSYVSYSEVDALAIVEVAVEDLVNNIWPVEDSFQEFFHTIQPTMSGAI